jgi:hypothetical protein
MLAEAVKASLPGVAISLPRSKTPAWETSASGRSDDILTAGRVVGNAPPFQSGVSEAAIFTCPTYKIVYEAMMNPEVNQPDQGPLRCRGY